MTVDETRFITEMLRGIRADVGDVHREMTNLSLRMTAMEHFQHGVSTQLLALQSSVDELKADMRRVKQRLELVEE